MEIAQFITSLGTLVALCALIYQMVYDRRNNKWAQANRISCWAEPLNKNSLVEGESYTVAIVISNASEQPIYNAVLSLSIVNNDAIQEIENWLDIQEVIAYVPPGIYYMKTYCKQPDYPCTFNAGLACRDIKGNYWSRNALGVLQEEKKDVACNRLKQQFLYMAIEKYKQ